MPTHIFNRHAIQQHFKLTPQEIETFITDFLAELVASQQAIQASYQQLSGTTTTERERLVVLAQLERQLHRLMGATCQGHVPSLNQSCRQLGFVVLQQMTDQQCDLTTLTPLYQQMMRDMAVILADHSSSTTETGDTAENGQVESSQPLQLLLVEDSPAASRAAQMLLVASQSPCQITAVENAAKAITRLTTNAYQGILLDLGLPDQDGQVVAETCRQSSDSKNRHTPIVVLSSHVDDPIRLDCLAKGVDVVWSKPLRAEQVHELFDEILVKPS